MEGGCDGAASTCAPNFWRIGAVADDKDAAFAA
jgi:hypothetical protein